MELEERLEIEGQQHHLLKVEYYARIKDVEQILSDLNIEDQSASLFTEIATMLRKPFEEPRKACFASTIQLIESNTSYIRDVEAILETKLKNYEQSYQDKVLELESQSIKLQEKSDQTLKKRLW